MTKQEIRDMIEKSQQRVRDMKENNTYTRECGAYCFGYQNALMDVLRILDFEEFDREILKKFSE